MAPGGKTVIARINDESKRKETLRIRKSGLVKKVSERTTLCDAEAAVVVYSPGDNQHTVWPSTSEAKATISKFLSRPEPERMANSHTAKRLIKMNEERNIQALINSIENGKTRYQDLDSEQKEKVTAFTNKKKKRILKDIQRLKGKEQKSPHSPQVLPPALQMPPTGPAGSSLNMNGLAAGKTFPSPAASHGQLNASGMTQLAPLPFSLPMHNSLIMSPKNPAANRLDMTRRLQGQTNLGGMMQRAPYPPRVLRPALQMQTVSHATRGLNKNGFAHGRTFPSPAAAAHGQHMNHTGMTQGTPPFPLSLPTANLLVMPPNNVAANSVNMTQRFYGQKNLGGIRQHLHPSPASKPPALSTVPTVFSAGGIPDVTDDSLIQRGPPPYMPRRLGLPPTLPTQHEASGLNMTRNDHRWNTYGFPTAVTAPLDQSNSDDGTSIREWVDGGATYEVNNAPPFTVKW